MGKPSLNIDGTTVHFTTVEQHAEYVRYESRETAAAYRLYAGCTSSKERDVALAFLKSERRVAYNKWLKEKGL